MDPIFLSVVIPAYKEAKRIGVTLLSLESYFKDKTYSYEIIVVNDGSPDDTSSVVSGYIPHIRNLRLIDNEVNRGKGHAVNCGMREAKGQYRLFMDADNSVHISTVEDFLPELEKGNDVVIGSIALSDEVVEHNGWHRRVFGTVSKFFIRNIATPGIYDTQRGFKLFTTTAADAIFPKQTINRFGFDIELLVIARTQGFKIKELPVVFDNPDGSTVTLSSYVDTLKELVKIIFNRVRGAYSEEGFFVRIKNIFGPKAHLHMKVFSPEMRAQKGKGFTYKDKEFVHHSDLHHTETAFYNLIHIQKVILAISIFVYGLLLLINWHMTVVVTISVITVVYFFDFLFNAYLIYRSFSEMREFNISRQAIASLKDGDLPMYTIFCPLYKEWQVVPQFVKAMTALDYPTEKLQIVFLLEENDKETVDKIRNSNLPPHFEIIVVPHSSPKTKPKAMNYGLPFVKGEYLVIYDAEDVPEVDQLKKVIRSFERASAQTVCIQAKLNFYNVKQNLLTRMFTAEYSLWFDLVLPGLQSINAPIPLGGTSNHFKVPVLRSIFGWDAFNVTEDCDLGMRLAKKGYRTAIVESTTYEEANSQLMNWYNQRSRWIKGYIQTYFVHMRDPKSFIETGNIKDFIVFQLTVGGKILSMFINPLMWIITICYFLFRAKIGLFIESFFPGPILILGVFSLIFGNFLYVYYYMVGCLKRGYDHLIKYIFLVPFYWLGMSLAAWKAAYEVIVKPHYWSKTVHGLHLKKEVTENITVAAQVIPQALTGAPLNFVGRAKKLVISGSGLFVASAVITNFINFLFNAYLGRKLSLEDFGVVSVLNTLVYFLSIFISAFSTTVTHKVAYIQAKEGPSSGVYFFKHLRKMTFIWTVGISVLWFVFAPFIAHFFKISDIILVVFFAPTIIFGLVEGINNGFLQGNLNFYSIGITTLVEAITKCIAAFILVKYQLNAFVALSLPVSLFISYVLSTSFAYRIARSQVKQSHIKDQKKVAFPFGFYGAALLTNLSTMAFLSVDVVLVKHFLDPASAGLYSLLSLVGKMVFFFGSLLNIFIIAYVSRDEGKGKNPSKAFYKILATNSVMIFGSALALGYTGNIIVPLLLGVKAIAIIPYLPVFTFSLALFTLTTTITTFHLARKHYLFSWVSLGVSLLLAVGIIKSHQSIEEVVEVVFGINVLYASTIFILHVFYGNLKLIFRNFLDVVRVFEPLTVEHKPVLEHTKKRILIFNWRDMKHSYAGGAEVYIETLARNWVKEGHSVTMFCGNDGKNAREELVDGVRIIRRGGFYFIYPCAFLYYMWHFRGTCDVVVDCENGIPFFTPLYVKEPVYCLVHHVHQEIFWKHLNFFLASVASFLERYAMPVLYRKSKFITVSESSRQDLINILDLPEHNIDIVSPGIDSAFLKPGKKSLTPLVVYLGRLKAYKSIDVLIKAFAITVQTVKDAHLVIAGDGEESTYLKHVVQSLNIGRHVTFTGKISDTDKQELLQSAWISVNPSKMEGWGITTIEANACGTAVIASDVPGLRDSVRNGLTGFLVPYGSVDLFAVTMKDLLTNFTLRRTMEGEAVLWSKHFEWSSASERFLSLISEDMSHVAVDETYFKKPSILTIVWGALVLAVTSRFRKIKTEIPERIGQYVLQKEIAKKDGVKNVTIGTYTSGGKKFFVKRWEGGTKDLNYYFLLNEYLVSNVLSKKSVTEEIGAVMFPKVADCFVSSRSLSVVFEYIEGVTASDLPIEEQVNVLNRAMEALQKISKKLTDADLVYIGKRSAMYYTILIPCIYVLLLIHSPKYSKMWTRSFLACVKNIPSLFGQELSLSHRDLTPSNIIVSGNSVCILDCETAVRTVPGYDYAFLSVTPGHDTLSELLVEDHTHPNTHFLRNYIALHHVLGSGEYFKFDMNYLQALSKINA